MRYLIVIEETNSGFSAYVPDLAGCIAIGDSREEIEDNIQEAILFHLEGMKEDGIEIPKSTTDGLTMLIPSVT
jgi:predicted RNase H-like HicB family nuclease